MEQEQSIDNLIHTSVKVIRCLNLEVGLFMRHTRCELLLPVVMSRCHDTLTDHVTKRASQRDATIASIIRYFSQQQLKAEQHYLWVLADYQQ